MMRLKFAIAPLRFTSLCIMSFRITPCRFRLLFHASTFPNPCPNTFSTVSFLLSRSYWAFPLPSFRCCIWCQVTLLWPCLPRRERPDAKWKKCVSGWGLNDPLPVQYLRFLGNALRGDLGKSLWGEREVTAMIIEAMPATIRLTLAGMGVAILLGLALGIVAALNHNRWLDNATMVVALAGVSMPSFWLGLLLILAFAVNLRWFPVVGQGSWKSLVLPALALGFGASALIARMTRSELLEVLGQDYIRTAHAKGLATRFVVLRHALKNALIPVLTIVGLQFGALLSGTVIIETVFARQGLGRVAVDALRAPRFSRGPRCRALCGVYLCSGQSHRGSALRGGGSAHSI